MTRKALLLASIFLATPALPASAAGNAEAGKKKAAQCQTCHGMDGMSKMPDAPNLAGQNPIYLARTLNDYKTGARKNEMMSVIIGPLSAEDINDLAAYYSSIQITVKAPQ